MTFGNGTHNGADGEAVEVVCMKFDYGPMRIHEMSAQLNGDLAVLELEDCSKKVKDDFADAVSKLNTSKYETLVKSNDDDEKVNILLKTSKDTIKEMLIVDIDGDEATLVQIKGKIKRSDIDKMVKFSTK